MPIDMTRIQKQAQEIIDRYQIPSMSITCCHKGSFQTVNVGLRDVENQVKADENTLYSIGSGTKSFTAAAIAVLCDQGLLSMEDPIRKHIPEFGMYDPYVSEHLTVRDILCHRCGLPRHELAWYSRLEEYSEDDVLDMLRHLKPNEPFRYKMQYQNVMFALAGILIHRVSGMSWQEFVQKNLIEPLGMGPVSYDAPELATFETAAKGYRFFKDPRPGNRQVPYSRLHTMCPAGSLSMTSRQLAMWDAMFLHKGKAADGTQVISEKMCAQMTSPQMLISDPIIAPLEGYQDFYSYGLGLFVESYRGTKAVHHGGHIDGFIADQCFLPDHDFACTILTNSEDVYGARVMRYLILDAFLELEPVDWAGKFLAFRDSMEQEQEASLTDAKERAEASAAFPFPAALNDLYGTYRNPGYGTIKVSMTSPEDGSLRVELGTLTLKAVHYRSQYFLLTEEHLLPGVELEGEAVIDRSGKVSGIQIGLEPTDPEKIRFEKI